MFKQLTLAFLLGVLCTLAVQRWLALERSAFVTDMRLSYIEGFLETSTGGGHR